MSDAIDLRFTHRTPDPKLTDFINSFWILENPHEIDKVVTILPDGYFDVLFNAVNHQPFRCMVFGLATNKLTIYHACTFPHVFDKERFQRG